MVAPIYSLTNSEWELISKIFFDFNIIRVSKCYPIDLFLGLILISNG